MGGSSSHYSKQSVAARANAARNSSPFFFSRFVPSFSPNRLWLGLFLLWGVLLSGALNTLVGSPGAMQALRLRELLGAKQGQITTLQTELSRLEEESHQLEKNPVIQQREIRKVLGYAASDELIFDFSTGGESGL